MPLPPVNRRVQLRVAYAPGFTAQSAIGTPLATSALTQILTTREGGQSHIEPVYKTEDLNDCTTEYLVERLVLHRYARMQLDLDVDAATVFGLLGLAFGNVAGGSASMLGPNVFALPLTTFVVGFADGTDPGILFQDAACNSITITGRVDQKLQLRVEFIGNALMPDAGFSFPDCTTITALRLDINTKMIVNGANKVTSTRSFEFNYGNNMPVNDFPWTLGALDVERLERGDKRTMTMAWVVEGRENDAYGVAARAVPRTKYPFELDLGSDALGGVVSIVCASALFEPQATFQSFDGEVGIAVLQTMFTPLRIPGNAATPLTAALT